MRNSILAPISAALGVWMSLAPVAQAQLFGNDDERRKYNGQAPAAPLTSPVAPPPLEVLPAPAQTPDLKPAAKKQKPPPGTPIAESLPPSAAIAPALEDEASRV